jgi:hypothetical protein
MIEENSLSLALHTMEARQQESKNKMKVRRAHLLGLTLGI